MGDSKNIFQYVLLGGFLILAVIAVIIFATTTNTGTEEAAPVVVWGTLNQADMEYMIGEINRVQGGFDHVIYQQVNAGSYYQVLVEAIAAGQGPDLFMIDQKSLVSHWNKILVLPWENFPEQLFKGTYIEGGEIFLGNSGVIALPFWIDPLVMYWNRDMFTNAGVSQVPKYWDEFFTIAPEITRVDNELNVLKSTIAFGEVRNVYNSKEILSTLIMQSGSPIVSYTDRGLFAALTFNPGAAEIPAVSALRFFTEFSNPIKTVYSWNRSLPLSRDAFVAGDLAVYFGFASEAAVIARLNPNLNYDITLMPQVRGTQRRLTYANIAGLAIPKASRNPGGAFLAAQQLTSQQAQAILAERMNLPPIRRDMLAQPQSQNYWDVVYDSALIARAWHDPAPAQTSQIFGKMVESVSSGAERVNSAVGQAQLELSNLLR